MVLKRISSLLLIASVVLLSSCASSGSKIPANSIVNAPSQAASSQLGNARPGDVVDLPAGNIFGQGIVVVGNDYMAASGRLCRRLRSDNGSELSRIVCMRETGQWYSPRSLYSSDQSAKQSFQATATANANADEGESIDLTEVDNKKSIVVVELGDDDLQSGGANVQAAITDIETQKHTLEAGETLWSFSRRLTGNALNWQVIADLNGIDDSRRLAAGDTLLVPKALVRGEL